MERKAKNLELTFLWLEFLVLIISFSCFAVLFDHPKLDTKEPKQDTKEQDYLKHKTRAKYQS